MDFTVGSWWKVNTADRKGLIQVIRRSDSLIIFDEYVCNKGKYYFEYSQQIFLEDIAELHLSSINVVEIKHSIDPSTYSYNNKPIVTHTYKDIKLGRVYLIRDKYRYSVTYKKAHSGKEPMETIFEDACCVFVPTGFTQEEKRDSSYTAIKLDRCYKVSGDMWYFNPQKQEWEIHHTFDSFPTHLLEKML